MTAAPGPSDVRAEGTEVYPAADDLRRIGSSSLTKVHLREIPPREPVPVAHESAISTAFVVTIP